jgi:pimeloyl-ACP methyl ester carboxylesterase
MLTEQVFNAGGISINYAESAPSGQPLVMLHGLTTNWESLMPLIPILARVWHVYACDLRGHGKSSWAKSGYRAVDFVPDITAFIRQRVGKPTTLLGFSVGGLVALATAAQLPKYVRALIVLEPILFLRNAPVQAFQSTDVYKWIVWVYETITSTHSIEEVVIRCRAAFPESNESSLLDMAAMIHHVDPNAVATLLNNQTLVDLDLTKALQQVTCPTLLLYGEADQGSMVRSEDVEFMQAHVPQTAAIQVKGAGHSLDWQQSEKVLGHITAFLQTVEAH